mgnify:CR=1 FL=1
MFGLQFEVTVVDVRGNGCARYHIGDRFVFKNDAFGPQWSSVDVFCVHSINRVYDSLMKLWTSGQAGDVIQVPCSRDCLCTFEIKMKYLGTGPSGLPKWKGVARRKGSRRRKQE